MIIGLIVKSFILAGLIGGIGVAFFMWLNSRDSSRDELSYQDNYCVKDDISKQYDYRDRQEEEQFDHQHALRHYASGGGEEENKSRPETNDEAAKVSLEETPEDITTKDQPDAIDAELIEDLKDTFGKSNN